MCVEETEKLRMVLTVGKELARKKLRKAYRGGGGRDGSHNKVATVTLLKQRWFRSMLHAFMSCSVIMQM
jgi:hypothetical protein